MSSTSTPGTALDIALSELSTRVSNLEGAVVSIQNRLTDLENGSDPNPIPDPDPDPDPDPIPDPDPDPNPTPIPTGIKTLLGTAQSSYWSQEDAFINHILVTGRDYNKWVTDGVVDAVTGVFTLKTGPITIGIVRDGSSTNPAHYAGKWVLDWEGDGDLTLNGNGVGTTTRVSANRIEEQYDGVHSNPPQVVLTRTGPGGVHNIRYYRASHEEALKSGKVYDPDWIKDVKRFSIVRPMDWTGVNGGGELTASDRPLSNRPVFFNGRVPDKQLIKLAMECNSELWINAPALLGCTQAASDALNNRSLSQTQRVDAVAADFHTIINSNEVLQWARNFVAQLDLQNYPANRPIYFEPGPEVWNFTFAVPTEFAWGLGVGYKKINSNVRGNMRTGYGIMCNRLANAITIALAGAGRSSQPWHLIVGTHTADVSRTTEALDTIIAYGTPLQMSRYKVSTTSYHSGYFNWKKDNTLFGSTMAQSEWVNRWLSDLGKDRQGLWKRITDYALDPTPKSQNVAWMKKQWALHKDAAERVGAGWAGDYEGGGSHSVLDPALAADAAAVALYDEWHASADHAKVIKAIADGIGALNPNGIIANYIWRAGGRTPKSPWIEAARWDTPGEDIAMWESLLGPKN